MSLKAVFLICLTLLFVLMATGVPIPADADPDGLVQEKLDVAFMQSAFLGVNRLDAEAAFKAFAWTVGESKGYDVAVTVRTFDTTRELEEETGIEGFDLLILDSWSYLEMNPSKWIEPVFVSSNQGDVASRYLLLTLGGGDLNTLTDLRGKSLNLFSASNHNLGVYWLQALLRKQALGMPETFFGALEYHANPTKTVLPVFFGKKDAALVEAAKFELMTELNPQLNKCRAIYSSEPLVNTVVCVNRSGRSSERFRQDLVQAMADLHLKPTGQQILSLFRLDQMAPFEQSHLDTVRSMYSSIISTQNRPPGAPGRIEPP